MARTAATTLRHCSVQAPRGPARGGQASGTDTSRAGGGIPTRQASRPYNEDRGRRPRLHQQHDDTTETLRQAQGDNLRTGMGVNFRFDMVS
jgi:hypothetical protein